MRLDVWSFYGGRQPSWQRTLMAWGILFVLLGRLAILPAIGDGCFVFRWNKNIDINEPTQKAIIVHDSGREDLLLQVKYEGPLEQFGWLIPVPSLPTVEKGSMQAFYELSHLTQGQLGGFDRAATMGAATRGAGEESVKVIEVKTVGAYEVAVLSAQDAGSLERWLKAHDYSIPEGKAGIIDQYISQGWYFVAAKINLAKPVAFQRVVGATPKATSPSAQQRNAIQKQLRSGELHPLLISFDTPKCIYPLKISAMGGKPSEVSLYVLSAEALLDKFIFDKGLNKVHQRLAERDRTAKECEKMARRSMQNIQSMRLATMMYSLASPGENTRRVARDWSLEDIQAIGRESWPDTPPEPLDQRSYATAYELLPCLHVAPEMIPQCAKDLPRLKGKSWHLTKQLWNFQPGEMHDLEFQPALPVLAAALSDPAGDEAAGALTYLGASADSVLIKACRSANALQRINASSVIGTVHDPGLPELLLTLLKDDSPKVRYNALMATPQIWDPRFVEPLIALFRDPHPEIRQQTVQWLGLHESKDRAPTYIAPLRDPDPDVQACALEVLVHINRAAIPRPDLLRLLGSPRLAVVSSALDLLQQSQTLDFLARRRNMNPPYPARRDTNFLSSAEAAPLTTNRLTMARLIGLKILRQNADAQAVALTLPLLRDTNSIVRNRAYALLRTVSGQDLPPTDPAKWEQWWAASKDTFVTPKPPR